MSTFYLSVNAVQSPISVGSDIKRRNMWSVNFRVKSYTLPPTFEDDMLSVLSSAGYATLNVDSFIGPNTTIPDGNGPYLLLRDTGGAAPDETHNGDVYADLSFQVTVYASSYTVGRTRANNIWKTLNGKYSFTV